MKLLLEAEIIGHAVFPPDKDGATLSVPEKNIVLRLRNLEVSLGSERPLLEALLIFEGESLEAGLETGKSILRELLDSLSYVTSFKFQFHRLKRLIDWSDGDFARRFNAYADFPGHDLPYFELTPDLLSSAGTIWQVTKGHPLETAVHWFSSGVKATILEDQFQFFWFALELIASYGKDTTPVPDLCAVCHSPLHCEVCGTHPTHRPYQKQAIEQLIHVIVGDQSASVSERLFTVRNMLMHGSTRDEIEVKMSGKLRDCVEDVAQITKRGILQRLQPDLAKATKSDQFGMLLIQGYARTTMTTHAIMTSSSIPPNFEMLNRLAMPEINMIFSERSDAASSTNKKPS